MIMSDELRILVDATQDYLNLLTRQVFIVAILGLLVSFLLEGVVIIKYIREKSYKDIKNLEKLKPLFTRILYVISGVAIAYFAVAITNFFIGQFILLNNYDITGANLENEDQILHLIPLGGVTLYIISGYFLALTGGIRMFVIISKVLFIVATLLVIFSAMAIDIIG